MKHDHLIPNPPIDLESFWNSITRECFKKDLDFSIAKSERVTEDHDIFEFKFKDILNKDKYGWIAVPKNIGSLDSVGAFLWLNPYGRWSTPPNSYTTRPGHISMSFNFHGEGPFHFEKYSPEKGYFTDGIQSEHTFVFKYFYQDAVLAGRILEQYPGVDSSRIGVMGLSQGGGMSIWMASFCPFISYCCADLPFFIGLNYILGHRFYRYPIKEIPDYLEKHGLNKKDVLKVLNYFDTLNIAIYNTKPVQLSLGLKDPACKPEAIRALYNHITSKKNLIEYLGGHDYDTLMIKNNYDWIKSCI